MSQRFCALLALVPVLFAGCGEREDDAGPAAAAPVLTAATLGEQQVLDTADYLSMPPYAGADREAGRKQAQLCRACHSLDAGGPHMIGPNLHGFFGQTIGSRAGFDYSEAVSEADFVWTPRALDAWLAEPGRFLPGNRMSFIGVANAADRANLIAYLLVATGDNGP